MSFPLRVVVGSAGAPRRLIPRDAPLCDSGSPRHHRPYPHAAPPPARGTRVGAHVAPCSLVPQIALLPALCSGDARGARALLSRQARVDSPTDGAGSPRRPVSSAEHRRRPDGDRRRIGVGRGWLVDPQIGHGRASTRHEARRARRIHRRPRERSSRKRLVRFQTVASVNRRALVSAAGLVVAPLAGCLGGAPRDAVVNTVEQSTADDAEVISYTDLPAAE